MAEVAPPSARSPTLSGEDTSFSMSAGQRLVLLLLYCTAQFMDAFSNTAIFSALPELQEEMEMNVGDGTWVVAAFTLTFSSFLLVSGRIADVYKPSELSVECERSQKLMRFIEFVFVIGVGGLGVLSLVAGFMNSKIPLIVLRALCGICALCAFHYSPIQFKFIFSFAVAALSIPSALTLLVKTFPEPTAQARAIGLFGGLGSIGVVLGLIIGAIFVQFTSWRWTFWFVAIMEVTVAAVAVVLVPPHQREDTVDSLTWSEKLRRLDLVGVSLLTCEY